MSSTSGVRLGQTMCPSSGQEEFYKIPNDSGWTIWPVIHTHKHTHKHAHTHARSQLSPWCLCPLTLRGKQAGARR